MQSASALRLQSASASGRPFAGSLGPGVLPGTSEEPGWETAQLMSKAWLWAGRPADGAASSVKQPEKKVLFFSAKATARLDIYWYIMASGKDFISH